MKTARKVELPEDRLLTVEEAEELASHAVNSAIWYAGRSSCSANQIREKLYLKGYPREETEAVGEGKEIFTYNFVEAAVEKLVDLAFVDDEALARSFVKMKLASGKGANKIRADLLMKGVSSEIVEAALAEAEGEELDEALEKAARQVVNSSAYTRLSDPMKRKEKLYRSLASKGFGFSDISSVVERFEEGM